MAGKKRWLYSARAFGMIALLLVGASASQSGTATPARAQSSVTDCVVVKTNPASGTARWLENCGMLNAQKGAEISAREVLMARAPALGLRPDGTDLMPLATTQTAATTQVRFAQVHQGVPVYLGQVLVQYDKAGAVQLINNHTLPNLDALNLSVTPAVGAEDATSTAAARIQAYLSGTLQLRAPTSRELMIYGEGKRPELVWHVIVYTQQPAGDWHVMVSAIHGGVLAAWNEIAQDSGLVYVPNAVQQSGDTSLRDNSNATSTALDNARVSLTLSGLTTNQLKGPAVDITAPGVLGCNLPYVPGQANEPTRIYSYARSDDRFEEVNVYAAISGVQAWFQSLGFSNVNNRSIPVNVHCTSVDNAYYSAADRALHFGDGGIDDAEDGDIVIHEYGHSTQDNQVPGWGPGSTTEQRAMGEGFGDFLAAMYYIDKGDVTYLSTYKYCIGEWDATVFNPVAVGNSGSGCLRWIDGRSEANGTPLGAYSGSVSEVHDDGRFWSAAMTCIYEGMGGNATARDDIIKLILTHHFSLTPDISNHAFEDSINALILADHTLFGGTHQILIANCAIARGLISTPKLLAPVLTAPSSGPYVIGGDIDIAWITRNAAVPNRRYTLAYNSTCSGPVFFNDSMESGTHGWSVSHIGGDLDWTRVTTDAHSPTHSWFAGDEPNVNEQILTSPQITLSNGAELSFWQRYDLERGYDGGVVEISTTISNTWDDLGPFMIQNGYNLLMANNPASSLSDRRAFTENSGGWVKTVIDLSGFDHQTATVRFREVDDAFDSASGWWIDDVSVREAGIWRPITTMAAGASNYRWTPPAVPGSYCVRVFEKADGWVDSNLVASASFTLTFNTPPTVSAIPNQAIKVNSTGRAISFTIGDAETPAVSLTLAISSSNTALVPNANLVLGGSGISRTLTLTPTANQIGSTTISIRVSDGVSTTRTSFALQVSNTPPTISAIANQTVTVNTTTAPLAFTIGDAETPATGLTLTASSSNTVLLPSANIALAGSGIGRTVTLTPTANQTGTTTITLTVNDGLASQSMAFALTVLEEESPSFKAYLPALSKPAAHETR